MYNLHVVYLFVSKRYSSTNSQLVFRVVWVTDITGPLMIFHTNHQLTDTQRLNMFDFYVYVIDCMYYIYIYGRTYFSGQPLVGDGWSKNKT